VEYFVKHSEHSSVSSRSISVHGLHYSFSNPKFLTIHV